MTSWLLPTATGILLVLHLWSALLACSLRDFSRSRLEDACKRRGKPHRFGEVLAGHDNALVSIELLFLIVTLPLLGIVWSSFAWTLGSGDIWSWVGFITRCATLIVVVVCTSFVLPWVISRVAGESAIVRAWRLVKFVQTLLLPLISLVRKLDTIAHRLAGLEVPTNGARAAISDEIRSVVDEGQRGGLLEEEAQQMIHKVIELQEEDVAAVMTPRTEMVTIGVDCSLQEARSQLLEAGHSRVPVIGDGPDDMIGILYAKDLLRHIGANGSDVPLREIVREAVYVPETTGIDKLLERMKRERVHIAIVIDEYSGVAGLVTMEDILEEIVGEITDEYDPDEADEVHVVSQEVIEVDGRVHIDDLNDRFDFELPEDGDYETIGGFVFTQLGRVPKPQDEFTWQNLRVQVLEADERRIEKVRLAVDPSLVATTTD